VSALNPLVVIDPSYTLSLWYGTVNNTIIFSTSTVMTATFDIGVIVDHHCLTFVLLILVQLLTITVCIVDIDVIIDHHCLTFFS
jgi:hypothetical protein